MKGDSFAFEGSTIGHLQFSLLNEFSDELRVMLNFVMPTEFRVFIFEHVETMWAARDNTFDAVSIHDGDVLSGLHLIQKLISSSLGRIAGTGFFLSENRKGGL